MKKLRLFSFLLITALSFLSINFSSCTGAKAANPVDVVNGTTPINTHDIEWRKDFIAKLKPLTPEQRKEEIDRVLPRLNGSLFGAIRAGGFDCEITSVTYMFGSGTADSVASGDGKKYNGYFEDQLYAVAKGPKCIKDSVTVFVQCFNGYVTLKGDESNQVVGTYLPAFTIQIGNGANRYVDYRTAIWLADIFDIPLHKGRSWKDPLITPKEAYTLFDKLGEVPVTMEVYPGDVFNLGDQTYTHNGVVKHAKKK